MTKFDGFGAQVGRWFGGLEADNSRAYFLKERDFFEVSIRDQLEALLSELSGRFGGSIRMFRQNRDVRFSPDKSPYKTHTAGLLERGGAAPLYLSISARGLVAGGGYHHMARDQLDRFREGIADARAGEELARAVAKARKAGLQTWGETLASAPRGYARDHERIELLRHKGLTLGTTLGLSGGISRRDGLSFVTKTWRAGEPVLTWLDRHVGASALPRAAPAPRASRRS
jgi:uncharacterized protein (TIGR02453 family)